MTERAKILLVGLACLVCCIPLVLGVAGVTSGVAGAVGVWLGHYEVAVVALLALVAVTWMVVRRAQSTDEIESGPTEGNNR